MNQIEVLNHQRKGRVDRRWLERLARFALDAESITNAEIGVALVDNETIHRTNRDFLQHDFATDVITFPHPAEEGSVRGELVISVEYAMGEASSRKKTLADEVGLYVVHGILHLVGYDDVTPELARVMHRRQSKIMKMFAEKGTRSEGSRPKKRASTTSK